MLQPAMQSDTRARGFVILMFNLRQRQVLVAATAVPLITASALAAASTPTAAAVDWTTFSSPSGNITCRISELAATCRIEERDWTAPVLRDPMCGSRPADIPHISAGAMRSMILCSETSGPIVTATPEFALPFGESLTAGQLTCASAPSGMTCTDAGTGNYFNVSRESYEIT